MLCLHSSQFSLFSLSLFCLFRKIIKDLGGFGIQRHCHIGFMSHMFFVALKYRIKWMNWWVEKYDILKARVSYTCVFLSIVSCIEKVDRLLMPHNDGDISSSLVVKCIFKR